MTNNQIPTTIFTGFLGSGKSTIILYLIDILQAQGQQVVYVKNEIGEVDVDTKLMKGKNIETKELLNGCICCTLVGPFMAAVDEIADTFQPDRIIIEASGAADPSAIAMMVSSHPRLNRDGVISVVDVVNFQGYKDLSETARNQTKFTDLIVFNKIELVDLAQKQRVVGYVRELNNHSPIFEAPEGKIDPSLIFGLNSKDLTAMLAEEGRPQADQPLAEAEHDSQADQRGGTVHTGHLKQDGLESFHCTLGRPIDENKLLDFLTELPRNVFRVKGFVQLNNEKMRLVNRVGVRSEISDPPPQLKFQPSQLVFIGFRVKDLENEICEKLEATA